MLFLLQITNGGAFLVPQGKQACGHRQAQSQTHALQERQRNVSVLTSLTGQFFFFLRGLKRRDGYVRVKDGKTKGYERKNFTHVKKK